MDQLLGDDQGRSDAPKFKKIQTSAFSRFLVKIGLKSNKKESADESDEPVELDEEVALQNQFELKEFMGNLKLFKFYLATNFYDDNIGRIELVNIKEEIIINTF